MWPITQLRKLFGAKKSETDIEANRAKNREEGSKLATRDLIHEARLIIQAKAPDFTEKLLALLKDHDKYAHDHSLRVHKMALAFADFMGDSSAALRATLDKAAKLINIGKLGIPTEILTNPERLAGDKFAEKVKPYVAMGRDLLSRVLDDNAIAAINDHRHYFNGDPEKSYPNDPVSAGLPRSKDSTIAGRILSLCDAADAMINRPTANVNHGAAKRSITEVIAAIEKHPGTQFDPILANKFCQFLANS